jgi:hypothetical protein
MFSPVISGVLPVCVLEILPFPCTCAARPDGAIHYVRLSERTILAVRNIARDKTKCKDQIAV